MRGSWARGPRPRAPFPPWRALPFLRGRDARGRCPRGRRPLGVKASINQKSDPTRGLWWPQSRPRPGSEAHPETHAMEALLPSCPPLQTWARDSERARWRAQGGPSLRLFAGLPGDEPLSGQMRVPRASGIFLNSSSHLG